jgi:hypothetical protein
MLWENLMANLIAHCLYTRAVWLAFSPRHCWSWIEVDTNDQKSEVYEDGSDSNGNAKRLGKDFDTSHRPGVFFH